MPDLLETLRAAQVAARKAGDKDRTLLLGTVLAALKNRELESPSPLTDQQVIEVLRKQIKQREDSVEQYTGAQRPELAAREQAEIEILRTWLPPEIDPEVIRAAARTAVADGASDLGKLMGKLMAEFRGRADGKLINQIAREALGQG
jgi:uncharacterized protein YqeY